MEDEDGFDEDSDFECFECGEELDSDDTCVNPDCPNVGECGVHSGGDCDWRQEERRQMGITS